jgi:hypothetical protein
MSFMVSIKGGLRWRVADIKLTSKRNGAGEDISAFQNLHFEISCEQNPLEDCSSLQLQTGASRAAD